MMTMRRRVKRLFRIIVWVGFFALANCWLPSCDGHDSAFTSAGLLTASRDSLAATTIAPVMNEPIAAGRNVVWCGTFQLAWNEACALVGEDLHFANAHPSVAELNARAFARSDLDDASFVALAGFVGDGIFAKIDAALRDKFRGRASPGHLPARGLTPRPQDIVAYSYLFKHLRFAVPFEAVDGGMDFQGCTVEAFGLPRPYKPGHQSRYGQVLIYDYKSPDDFVVELKTTSADDRLVLAKVTPGATLAATVATVRNRLDAGNAVNMAAGDVLLAPKMNFDLTAEFNELCGHRLIVSNPRIAKDLLLLSAGQNIWFQLDEKGVRLRSESHMSFGCSASAGPLPQHELIFDKPFLVMLARRGSSAPYFAMWVANPELLIRRR